MLAAVDVFTGRVVEEVKSEHTVQEGDELYSASPRRGREMSVEL